MALEGPLDPGKITQVREPWRVHLRPPCETPGTHVMCRLTSGEGLQGDGRRAHGRIPRVFASGWEGTGRVQAYEAPRRLLLHREPDQPDEQAIEITLTANGDQTIVVWEERGMPVAYLAGYGAGIQVHVEDLGAYLAGRERCDAGARMGELFPAYEPLAAKVG